MRTLLFCTCYINSEKHLERYTKWFDFYYPLQSKLNFTDIVFIDDASEPIWLLKLYEYIKHKYDLECLGFNAPIETEISPISIYTFREHFGRQNLSQFAGWWRSFAFGIVLAHINKYDRVLFIESDTYLLSKRIVNYIAKLKNGLNCFFTKFWEVPETNILIIGKEMFMCLITKYWNTNRNFWFKNNETDRSYIPELCLPFTNIITKYKGDRYGEDFFKTIPTKMDFICNINSTSMNGVGLKNLENKIEQINKMINKSKILLQGENE